MRLGVLGGTFDPIHNGHLAVADAACAALGLARVLLVPSHHPPHRPTEPRVGPYHRFAMTSLAVLARGSEYLASDLELSSDERSYTASTLRRLHDQGCEASTLFFITGADAFAEIATWKEYPAIFDLAHFVVVSRPGHPASAMPRVLPTLLDRMIMGQSSAGEGPMRRIATGQQQQADEGVPSIWLIDAPTPAVSSTDIRRRLRTGESIAGLVPDTVDVYIRRHGLYRATGGASTGKALA